MDKTIENLAVLGAGNAGTTLADVFSRKKIRTKVWTVEEDVSRSINEEKKNPRYLPGVRLSDDLICHTDISEALDGVQAVIFAVPSRAVRPVALNAKDHIPKDAVIVNIAKGLERSSHMRMSEVIEDVLGPEFSTSIVALSGPMIANEVAGRLPTCVAISCRDMHKAEVVSDSLSTDRLNLMLNQDMVGIELGGALKNIIAIGAGICDGLGFGVNTKSALISRGFSEITHLGTTMGAKKMTFLGLAGLGDLNVTCTSKHSRNRTFGEKVGSGLSVEAARREMEQVTEGYFATETAYGLARERNVRLPVIESIYEVLYKDAEASSVLAAFFNQRKEEIF